MNIRELNLIIENKPLLKKRLEFFSKKRIIQRVPLDKVEILGHIKKAEHNLNFVKDNLNLGYGDWCVTGCYYAVYHAALSLILAKGIYSKNHDATLCLLIKEYFNKGVDKEDIFLINRFFIDYLDLVVYVQAKNRREDATYSTRYKFDKKSVEDLRIKAILFVNKCKGILNNFV